MSGVNTWQSSVRLHCRSRLCSPTLKIERMFGARHCLPRSRSPIWYLLRRIRLVLLLIFAIALLVQKTENWDYFEELTDSSFSEWFDSWSSVTAVPMWPKAAPSLHFVMKLWGLMRCDEQFAAWLLPQYVFFSLRPKWGERVRVAATGCNCRRGVRRRRVKINEKHATFCVLSQ